MKTLAIAMILAIAATTTVETPPPQDDVLDTIRARLDASARNDTAIVTHHARQFTRIGEQTTSVHKWQIETLIRHQGRCWPRHSLRLSRAGGH